MAAVREIDAAVGVVGVSRAYDAEPVGAPETPMFLNAAVAVTTDRPPDTLKDAVLRPIETRLGRRRTQDANAPRTIDIDIALAGDLVTTGAAGEPEIPDPDIARLAHVAFPLRDLAPDLRHPLLGRTLGELAAALEPAEGIAVRDDIDLSVAVRSRDPASGGDSA